MVDLSLSMPMRDNFLAAKKVAMALHSLISTQYPRDYLGIVGFSEVARELKAEQLPEVSWDFLLARRMLARQSGTKQIIMITDGEPTAHLLPGGEVFFNYPPVHETVQATLTEVARCTREGIKINTFMLDATGYLKDFVEKLTRNGNLVFVKNWGRLAALSERDRAGSAGLPARSVCSRAVGLIRAGRASTFRAWAYQ